MFKFDPIKTTEMANALFKEERAINHLEGWFIVKEAEQIADEKIVSGYALGFGGLAEAICKMSLLKTA